MQTNPWLALAIISGALLLIGVDMTVLNVALPRLTQELGATNSDKLWMVNAYSLVMAGLLPSFGTLADKIGHRTILLWGLAVFGVASLVAAFSPAPGALIAARGLLAVGAAMMMPATLSIVRIIFTEDQQRATAIGIWGAVWSGAAALGPILGGVLLAYFWWGSVFLINVPIVIVVFYLALNGVGSLLSAPYSNRMNAGRALGDRDRPFVNPQRLRFRAPRRLGEQAPCWRVKRKIAYCDASASLWRCRPRVTVVPDSAGG